MSAIQKLTKDLPPEPLDALFEFAERALKEPNLSPDDYLAVAAFIKKFCEKFLIPLNLDYIEKMRQGSAWQLNQASESVKVVQQFREKIKRDKIFVEVDDLVSEYAARTNKETFGIAYLNSDEKQKIQAHLNRIRKIIEESPISERKKNALFERFA